VTRPIVPTKKPVVCLEPKDRTTKIIKVLEKEHPDAKIALHYADPLQLLISTILSAQTTDERVNIVTQTLFKKYRKAEDYANVDIKQLEQDIHSTGFYHNKAKNIQETSRILVDKYGGKVPGTMEQLVELPGVARKTANIVLYNGFGIIAGIAVDTHVRRLSQRLGLSETDDPSKIERDLMLLVPHEKWMEFTDLLIFHGRRICMAKKPNCAGCVLSQICPSAFTFG
jgi:endonuclease III